MATNKNMLILMLAAFGGTACPSPATGDGLLVFEPGVTNRGAATQTWEIDVSGPNSRDAASTARLLSSRLYGRDGGTLHRPLVFRSGLGEPNVFAFHLVSVSLAGSDLLIRTNGVPYHRKSWPPSATTRWIRELFAVPLPPGKTEVSLEVTQPNGVVVIDKYYLADSINHLPVQPNVLPYDPPGEVPATRRSGDVSKPDTGYRGIWFTLGQRSEHGDKYSGGLGTYTANHVPLAVYSERADKTFFVYGGAREGRRHLLAMASYYDHKTGEVPRPTIVHDKRGVNDPHDNPSISLDDTGHVWVFISGRGRVRPGFKYRSKAPFSVDAFELVAEEEFTYPQPWFIPGRGFLHLFTKYTNGRELYWETSDDGKNWSGHQKLAGIGGHYQVSGVHNGKVGTFFNRHPGGNVDRRTDLYYAQTADFGRTWTTVDGTPLTLPLGEPDNAARVVDYAAQARLAYTLDLNFDQDGNPLLLHITSHGHEPGPQNDPREWVLTRWTGSRWESHVICRSDHNYDMGSLYVFGDEWRVIGPTQPGPQPYQSGGELAVWTSSDKGRTWTMNRQVTRESNFNHNYARRPVNARDPFSVFWADGDPLQLSTSRLYFGSADGEQVWQLPYDMQPPFASPGRLQPVE